MSILQTNWKKKVNKRPIYYPGQFLIASVIIFSNLKELLNILYFVIEFA
jgi:hypothetical protein